MQIHEALEDINIAFKLLEFSIKLLSYCELGKINPQDFDADHLVMLEGDSLNFPTRNFSNSDSISATARINVSVAFSASALVLDKGFEVMRMKPDPECSDEVGQLRMLIYMVRCAQAHGIAEPKWEVRGKFLRATTVDLGGALLSLDLQALNGQVFSVDQLGGYGNWYRIRSAALAHLSR